MCTLYLNIEVHSLLLKPRLNSGRPSYDQNATLFDNNLVIFYAQEIQSRSFCLVYVSKLKV